MNVADLFSLKGKVALVTGGNRSIGKWIAEGLVAAGAKVYISARDAELLTEVARELGPNCHALVQDIGTVDGCKALAAAFLAQEDKLDILVNNAGASWGAPFDEFPETGWDKVMNLNLKSPFFLTQALFEPLKKAAAAAGPAKVINITSLDAYRINDWESYSYQASKAALAQLTRRMAARLIKDGINVTAIAPGVFPSKMNAAARLRAEGVAKAVPAQRLGSPEDVAAAAIYLASRAGDYVVGESVLVDGGLAFGATAASIDG